jgi:hypothetical protein
MNVFIVLDRGIAGKGFIKKNWTQKERMLE